ncbi:MAG: adenine phosphoribosyltransferase [Actinobacteria bacterium]|nr:adenine phosphoribosyltransferase [Actinomycetota bacterium]
MVASLIRDIPDFPRPGILFRDITTVLKDAKAWRVTVDWMCAQVADLGADTIIGIESRGFIMGSAMAYELDLGFVPVRKAGKLPYDVHSAEYELEYGTDALEIHTDALTGAEKVIIVDDLLATGGTAAAAVDLVEKCQGQVLAMTFLIELLTLNGREKLPAGVPITAMVSY